MMPTVIDPARVIRDALKGRSVAPRTQTQLAAAAGLTWRQWTQRMRGDVAWRLDELDRIATALRVPLCDLVGDEEPKP
jgi:hypothetical protein